MMFVVDTNLPNDPIIKAKLISEGNIIRLFLNDLEILNIDKGGVYIPQDMHQVLVKLGIRTHNGRIRCLDMTGEF